MRTLSADEVRWLRVRAQGLAGEASPIVASPTVAEAVRGAAAIQAQASGPARLQVWSRTQTRTRTPTRGLRAADVDAAVAAAAVVRTWLMRGTIHMVAADDLRPFLAVLGPVNLRADRRRRDQLGLTEKLCERAMEALPKILGAGRALTRAEIVAELAGHGVVIDPKSQQPPHLLGFAAHSGLICRGPDAARDEPTYVLLDDWSAHVPATPDRETALARLATRYFAAYGPATTADLVAWSGLPVADANAAVALIRDILEEVDHDGHRLLLPRGTEPMPPEHPYRLLARFDPYLLGHRSRELILDPAFAKRVNAGGGMIAQTMLADGRVVGTWKAGLLAPFEPTPTPTPAAASQAWQRELAAAAAF
ncbi:winged helix DNA-binding domain-containing protein [Catenulispora pinisilvae]|uniref:winged helix DNA-binding domain-containing protein n=1 Tax=Catenulispora pinisilvae TaxID=2705253 RepID=UPI001891AB8F|nr:winged helix DNA-binding domain-containing protein [Catenulispora pinisilvae]